MKNTFCTVIGGIGGYIAALYDEWSTATDWTTYASYMVAV